MPAISKVLFACGSMVLSFFCSYVSPTAKNNYKGERDPLKSRNHWQMIRAAIQPNRGVYDAKLTGMPDVIHALNWERHRADAQRMPKAPAAFLKAVADNGVQARVRFGCISHVTVAHQNRRH